MRFIAMRMAEKAMVSRLLVARICLSIFASLLLLSGASADDRRLIVQSTTSTQNSGLYDDILPLFEEATGIDVVVVAVGTGQALRNARNGDGDMLIVHAKSAEEEFVSKGYGVERFNLMYNDFVLLGPKDDPADIANANSIDEAFARIAKGGDTGEAEFVSRGDDSGTHKKELTLWAQQVDADLRKASGRWYLEAGSGMGATINIAVNKRAYTLSDRATWIRFANKGSTRVLYDGDPGLFNQYGVIIVNPKRHPRTNVKDAEALLAWLLGEDGQAAIGAYQLDGKQLFFPNAETSE